MVVMVCVEVVTNQINRIHYSMTGVARKILFLLEQFFLPFMDLPINN